MSLGKSDSCAKLLLYRYMIASLGDRPPPSFKINGLLSVEV